ncbi:MAG: biotin/lipoyl-binding protein [Planctomycetes bacterium]|nr:biotin/lipoyl-binding protein [Planctomycetota bacterium]
MIKKLIFGTVVVALVVCLWLLVRSSGGITLSHLQGETATLKIGGFTIPINADGPIEPKERMTIKSEAGGRVAEIFVKAGSVVREGDLLIRLDTKDEQRLVDIAEKALKQAELNLERSKNTRYQAEFVDVPRAQALLDAAKADFKYWQWRYEWYGDLKEKGQVDPDEHRQVESNYRKLKAQVAQTEAELIRANKNVEIADLDVRQAELGVERGKDDLDDAKERLKETQIVAPSAGMVSRLLVKKGEVIVSGSRSLTGGTPLAVLADVSEYYVRALVDEADIGRVREIAPAGSRPESMTAAPAAPAARDAVAGTNGDMPIVTGTPVKVTLEAYPDETFEGVIDLIEPEPNQSQQAVVISYVVRIRLTSGLGRDFPIGAQANVEFVSETVENAVLVPNEAVRYVFEKRGVYLQVDSERLPGKKVPKFHPFRAGLDNGEYTQVIEGLKKGDVVYTKLPRDNMGKEITGDED